MNNVCKGLKIDPITVSVDDLSCQPFLPGCHICQPRVIKYTIEFKWSDKRQMLPKCPRCFYVHMFPCSVAGEYTELLVPAAVSPDDLLSGIVVCASVEGQRPRQVADDGQLLVDDHVTKHLVATVTISL